MTRPFDLVAIRTAHGRLARRLAILLLLFALPTAAAAEPARFEALMASGTAAYQAGDFAAAARSWGAAVAEAETFGPLDPRLAASLDSLAEARRAQAR
ncbi:MAG: hypothetical protein R3322_19685, partial [Kiloniellales bacterium]|nr:hypothetical protein [Kiloniellales bacterium]